MLVALLYVRPFTIRIKSWLISFGFSSGGPRAGYRYRGGVRGTQFDTAARTAAGDTQLAPAAPHPRSGRSRGCVPVGAGWGLARRVLVAPDRDSKTHDRASIYSL